MSKSSHNCRGCMTFVPWLVGLLAVAPISSPAAIKTPNNDPVTENVVVIILGGIRESECLDAPGFGQCTFLGEQVRPNAVVIENFLNKGRTGQQAGRAMLATGTRVGLRGGPNTIDVPSLVQYWRRSTGAPAETAWVIGSNNEASVDNGNHPGFDGYGPMEEYGYRDDEAATRLIEVLDEYRPRIATLVLQEPDERAQYTGWDEYLVATARSDSIAWAVGQAIAEIPDYGERTAILYTDWHGRHDDDHGGFQWHGDSCNGCRNITFLATGPDFRNGETVEREAELIDVTHTIAAMLRIPLFTGDGRILEEIFLPGRAPAPSRFVSSPATFGDRFNGGPVSDSRGSSRWPDIEAIGDTTYVTWAEQPPDRDDDSWDILLSHSLDQGRTWTPPVPVLEATETLRPWRASIRSDGAGGLFVGVNCTARRAYPAEMAWTWKAWALSVPNPGEPATLLPEGQASYNYVGHRPAIVATDGWVFQPLNDTFHRRMGVAWAPTEQVFSWTTAYQWREFGYPLGIDAVVDGDEVRVVECLRSGMSAYVHVMRLQGKNWADDEVLFGQNGKRAIQPSIAAGDGITTVAWIDDTEGPWVLRTVQKDGAGWSEPAAVAPEQVDSYRPHIRAGDSGVLITWEDHSQKTPRIWAARSGDGGLTWGEPALVHRGFAQNPRILESDNGFAVVVWESLSHGGTQIFSSRIQVP